MRHRLALLIVASLALFGCGDDDGGTAADAAITFDAPAGTPVITKVSWNPLPGCVAGTASMYAIGVDATDPENQTLTYTISVPSCTGGPITAKTGMLTCPNQTPYPGTATVKDPDNHQASKNFTIEVCKSGMVQ